MLSNYEYAIRATHPQRSTKPFSESELKAMLSAVKRSLEHPADVEVIYGSESREVTARDKIDRAFGHRQAALNAIRRVVDRALEGFVKWERILGHWRYGADQGGIWSVGDASISVRFVCSRCQETTEGTLHFSPPTVDDIRDFRGRTEIILRYNECLTLPKGWFAPNTREKGETLFCPSCKDHYLRALESEDIDAS